MTPVQQYPTIPRLPLSTWIDEILSQGTSSYRVALVDGAPMDRLSILGRIERLRRARWDILSVRLSEGIVERESEFSALLMRNLAQEVRRMENVSEDLRSLVFEYLQPFEITEKSIKRGITLKFFMAEERKFVRRIKSHDDIMRDYTHCLDLIQELEWTPILILESVEKLSTMCESFLLRFLDRYGHRSVTVLAGLSEPALESFVHDQGIARHFKAAFVTCDVDDKSGSEANAESMSGVQRDVLDLTSCIVESFAIESVKFNYLKFDVWEQIGSRDWEGSDPGFDLCLLGHLGMREDYPRLIRTDYDCAILVKVLDEPITEASPVRNLVESAHRMLIDGVSHNRCGNFEPWDAFLFLAAPGISKTILDGYEHLPYRNLFVLLPDATFHNLSPHAWMGHVLNTISQKWCRVR